MLDISLLFGLLIPTLLPTDAAGPIPCCLKTSTQKKDENQKLYDIRDRRFLKLLFRNGRFRR